MSDPRTLVRTTKTALDLDSVLLEPTTTLIGVTDSEGTLLETMQIKTIFELAMSSAFADAVALLGAAVDRGSPLAQVRAVPGEILSSSGLALGVGQLADAPITAMRAFEDPKLAKKIRRVLGVSTVRELALWPPYQSACLILAAAVGEASSWANAYGTLNSSTSDDGAPPADLQPANGIFPTERVYYETLLLDKVGGTPPAADLATAGPLDLDAAATSTLGFTAPAEGAIMRLSQSWYAQGLTLGQLLHSVALAPGESVRIAMIDWTRRTRGARAEAGTEGESLTNSTTHGRSISEVTSAVATESQNGFSTVRSQSDAHQGGTAGGLGFFGWSDSSASNTSTGSSVTSSSGRRELAASMTQSVAEATHQAATAVRNRRATVVEEVSETEQSTATTRVVANYNHMHALTVQYYETVQIYKVETVLESVDRCLYIPMKLVDFDDLSRLGPELRALRPYVLDPVADDYLKLLLDGVRLHVKPRPGPDPIDSTASRDGTMVSALASQIPGLRARLGHSFRIEGNDVVFSRDAYLSNFEIPGAAGSEVIIRSGDGADQKLTLDASGHATPTAPIRLSDVSSVILSGSPGTTGTSTTATLSIGTATGGQAPVYLPIDDTAASSTLFSTTATISAAAESYLVNHLQAHKLTYNRLIWRALDPATIALLLSPYSYDGIPVMDQIDSAPIDVVGNFLVFRMHVTPSAKYVDERRPPKNANERWHKWLEDHDASPSKSKPSTQVVPLPSGGVFAEAVLGRANSAEKLDLTRFWNWQDSPIPLQPTEIAPPTTETRHVSVDLKPGEFPVPMVNIVSPTQLPDPTSMASVLQAISQGNMFRDMSGIVAASALAEAGLGAAASGATAAGAEAGRSFAEMNRHKEAMFAMVASMLTGKDIKAPARDNISNAGAAVNHGSQMDRARQTLDGSTPASGTLTTGTGGGVTSTGGGAAAGPGGATPSTPAGTARSTVGVDGGNEARAFDAALGGSGGGSIMGSVLSGLLGSTGGASTAPASAGVSTLTLNQKVPNKSEAATVGAISGKIVRGTTEFSNLVTNSNADIVFKDEEKTGADKLMTQSLSDKLDALAVKVKAEWPGKKLRVTEAWDEGNEHGASSTHYEGRAADITVDDMDSGKLGRLAQLAVDAGFDWVFYENSQHVHVSVKK
jgi:hypothetical protein